MPSQFRNNPIYAKAYYQGAMDTASVLIDNLPHIVNARIVELARITENPKTVELVTEGLAIMRDELIERLENYVKDRSTYRDNFLMMHKLEKETKKERRNHDETN